MGASWTLKQTARVGYDDEGQPTDTTVSQTSRFVTLGVVHDTVIDRETWALIEPMGGVVGFGHCLFGQPAWYANRDDGMYRWQGSVERTEHVFAVGTEPGVPFLETSSFVSALAADEPAYPTIEERSRPGAIRGHGFGSSTAPKSIGLLPHSSVSRRDGVEPRPTFA